MFGIILGLGAAITYGAADFLAGLASRRACVLSVVVWSQFVGLVALLLLLAVLPHTSPTRTDFLWGAAAGVTGAVGISLLYRALAVGRMSVVSPITAVVAAIIPVVFGVLRGERPPIVAYGGIALALLAVFLISSSAEQGQDGRPLHPDRRPFLSEPGLVEASVSGVAIGAFYIVISRAGHTAGLWPLVSYRIVSTTLVAAAALLTRRSLRPSRPSLQPIIFTGVLDIAANALYLEAVRRGLLAIVAVLASLYPASTVALANLVLKERFARVQIVGMVCAAISIVMIAL